MFNFMMIFSDTNRQAHIHRKLHSKTMSLLAQQISLICIRLLLLNSEMRPHKQRGQINFLLSPLYSQEHKNPGDICFLLLPKCGEYASKMNYKNPFPDSPNPANAKYITQAQTYQIKSTSKSA